MTTFQEARAFLLKHRTNYDRAVADFRWPDAVPFNWALDWFDADLARDPQSRDRPALWIVDAGSHRETKLSFAVLSRRSNPVAVAVGRRQQCDAAMSRPSQADRCG